MAAVRGLRRIDHVGVTVPDLDEADRFFVDVLGCELLFARRPPRGDGRWMSERLDVDERAVVERLHLYRLGDRTLFEVFSYSAPDQRTRPPRNSDIGGHHVALYVDDIDEAVSSLRSHGIRVLGEPTASDGEFDGMRWVYFLAPWGLQFELVSFPAGRAFERRERGSAE